MLQSSLEHHTHKKFSMGESTPLGVTLKEDGVNFALFSRYAQDVFLLLFDSPQGNPTDVIKLTKDSGHIWRIFIHGIKAGQFYGYKVRGDYNPAQGMRFNEHKLLIDPYARALTGKFQNRDNLLTGYDSTSSDKDLVIDSRDNSHCVPKSIVIDDTFDWQEDRQPNIHLDCLIIYEAHLKGFTAHPSSHAQQRGTYLGFIEKIPHLKDLGVNAVELLPIHESYTPEYLTKKGLSNYWGYNTIGFFAPESSYSSQESPGCQVEEFKMLVRELHKAGIEIILDVVYNHTGEGDETGPTVCLRGIDNPTYYALEGPSNEPYRHYLNLSGCGNILNGENSVVVRLVIDSLRYWAGTMHVDGFRFDLASILFRKKGIFDKKSLFYEMISDDPLLSKVKLIAEPWDLANYQVGNFPINWSEWNGKFRDTTRRFIKGDPGQIKDLAWRITGSSDLYGDDGRSPCNSINFITCHDGFTLYDLYAYNHKHNEANGEQNRDGSDDNNSWNCGVEGDTDDAVINNFRRQMVKNALCCVIFSLGTPMILAGDEFLRTQKGNNNAYCQDNDLNWINWDYAKKNEDILEFCKKAIQFKKRYTILQRRKFLSGQDNDNDTVPDVLWFSGDLTKPEWNDPPLRLLCYQLDGSESPSNLGNYHLFFIMNGDSVSQRVRIPQYAGMRWYRVVDTHREYKKDFLPPGKEELLKPLEYYDAHSRSIVVLLGKE